MSTSSEKPPLSLRAALEAELVKASATAGRDIGEDQPASLMIAWVARGQVNILYGGHQDPRFLELVRPWIDHAAATIRAKRGGEIAQKMIAEGGLFGNEPPEGTS